MIVNPGIRRFSGIKPALNLVFTGGESISSMITFTRASGGTRVNSAGLIETVPVNLLINSDDISQASWSLSGTASKTGTNVLNLPALADYAYATIPNQPVAVQYTVSGYFSGSGTFKFDAWNNIGSTQGSSAVITLTSTPTRYSFTATSTSAAGTTYLRIGRLGAGDTTALTLGKLQVEAGSVATTYIPTTTAASGAPRFDYAPVTLAPRGLLIEESRANQCIQSQTYSAWAQTGAAGTSAVYTSPDGTTTGSRVMAIAGNTGHRVYKDTLSIAAGSATFSCYLKYINNPWVVVGFYDGVTVFLSAFNVQTGAAGVNSAGATSTITPAGNGWYRVTVTATAALASGTAFCYCSLANSNTATFDTWNAAGTEECAAYGAQLEAGAFPTSYIPTTTAAVTRAADVASMTGTNFSSWFNATEGTFVASAAPNYTPANAVIASFSASSYIFYKNTNNARAYDGTTTLTDSGAITDTSTRKYALGYTAAGTTGTLVVAGRTPITGTYNIANGGAPSVLYLGSSGGTSAQINGHLQRISFYPRRLPDATLKALSA